MSDIVNLNTLICNPVTGVCEVAEPEPGVCDSGVLAKNKPIRIIYYTDPICSACWGIEPQLRKLKLEYGDYYEIEYKMGGLLPSWECYNDEELGKPADIAHHWEEAGSYYGMPIDGDIWLEDPLSSSYPPSIAFKAAQMQDEEKALQFFRRMKEMVFLLKKNISKWEWIEKAAEEAELDLVQLKKDFEGDAQQLFEEDLKSGKQMNVRGFPTLFFTDKEGNRLVLFGVRPYWEFEETLHALCPQAVKHPVTKTHEGLFDFYPSLTTHEFAVITDRHDNDALEILNELHKLKYIEKCLSKRGALWIKKN